MDGDEQDRQQAEPLTPVCAIGASAGGVRALQQFFETVGDSLGAAFVVIIHLSPDHKSQLSEILDGRTAMPVVQVGDSPELKPNCVYVIAPDRELVIEDNTIDSRPFTEPRGKRAPIDMFFRSVAAGRGDGLAVLLSGAGSDGSVGVQAIKEAGGVVFVQDPAEAEYGMMPRSAIATGVADFVEPIDRLVERIAEVAHSKNALRRLHEDEAEGTIRRIVQGVGIGALAAQPSHADAFAGMVYKLTGGNPLYILAFLDYLIERGLLWRDAAGGFHFLTAAEDDEDVGGVDPDQHQPVDGADAAHFVKTLVDTLQDPETLMLSS